MTLLRFFSKKNIFRFLRSVFSNLDIDFLALLYVSMLPFSNLTPSVSYHVFLIFTKMYVSVLGNLISYKKIQSVASYFLCTLKN